jgi:hypothetical protein
MRQTRRETAAVASLARAAKGSAGWRNAVAALLLLACWLVPWSTATADTATLTRFFDDQARTAFADRKYDKALAYFLLVDRATPSPGAAYNVAVTAHTAGENALAFAYLDRYLASDDTVEARRSDAIRRAAQLRGQLALVRVDSDPPGALIYVNLKEHGSLGTTPRTIVVAPGEHQILLDSPRHLPARVSVKADRGKLVAAKTKLSPRTGGLVVTTAPANAPVEVRRDGATISQIAAGHSTQLPIGRYELRIQPEGHHPASTFVVVEEATDRTATLVARPLPPKTGTLLVTTGAVAAELYVDGKHTAKTPATLRDVAIGERILEIRAAGYRSARRTVHVREGRSTFLELTLDRAKRGAP